MATDKHRLAILFPADAQAQRATQLEQSRLSYIAEALRDAHIDVVGAPYADAFAAEVRARLLGVDGVLVWFNPVEGGRDRSVLNALLKDVASSGVLVSAHPGVIDRIGTKEVLHRTRTMSWGTDCHLYAAPEALQAGLASTLAAGTPRVLKQIRGQSGDGVWKVELAQPRANIDAATTLRVRHAKRGSVEETVTFAAFLAQCRPYFAGHGGMLDQAYQPRLVEGMVRCYLVGDHVAGFGEQLVNALYPAPAGASPSEAPQPGPRLYFPPTRPDFQRLKDKLEREWLGELCRLVGIEKSDLPVLWDADFLYGPKDADGADTYVLCEINVSSVYPFPTSALAPLVAETVARLDARRRSGHRGSTV